MGGRSRKVQSLGPDAVGPGLEHGGQAPARTGTAAPAVLAALLLLACGARSDLVAADGGDTGGRPASVRNDAGAAGLAAGHGGPDASRPDGSSGAPPDASAPDGSSVTPKDASTRDAPSDAPLRDSALDAPHDAPADGPGSDAPSDGAADASHPDGAGDASGDASKPDSSSDASDDASKPDSSSDASDDASKPDGSSDASDDASKPDGSTTDAADPCKDDLCTDDGNVCNGTKVCDVATHTCIEQPPPECDDGLYCNGVETCDPVQGCVEGTPITCGATHAVCSEAAQGCACDAHWLGPDCDWAVQVFPCFSNVIDIARQEDLLWVATDAGIWLLDDNGTPADPSDDHYAEFTTSDGLAASTVLDIAVDEHGGKWVGEYYGGLQYFDDHGTPFDKGDDQWIRYYHGLAPTGDSVDRVAIDASGAKWVGFNWDEPARFDDGQTPFDLGDDTWQLMSALGASPFGSPQDMVAHPQRGVWFSWWTKGLYAYDDASAEWATFNTSNSGLPTDHASVLALEGDSGVWFATGITVATGSANATSLGYLDYRGTITDLSDDVSGTLSGLDLQYINAVAVDEGGLKWIGDGEVGLSRLDDGNTPLDPSDDEWTAVANELDTVAAIEPRSATELWFGGFDGLWYLRHEGTPTTADDTRVRLLPRDGPCGRVVEDVAIDAEGGQWLATDQGACYLDDGGTPLDRSDDHWAVFESSDFPGLTELRHVAVAPNGLKYFHGNLNVEPSVFTLDDGGTPLDKNDDQWAVFAATSPALDWVADMVVSPQGSLLLASNFTTGGLACLDDGGSPLDGGDDALVTLIDGSTWPAAESIAIDPDGGAWLAIPGVGPVFWDDAGTPCDPSDDSWAVVGVDAGVSTDVEHVSMAPDGGIWFAFSDSTLAFLDDAGTPAVGADDSWAFFGSSSGLPDCRFARTIAADQGGVVWLNSETEPARLDTRGTPLDPSDDVCRTFPAGGGMPALGYAGTVVVDPQGGAWFGTGEAYDALVYLAVE
jgi:hypothetical protein